jgi:multiple sugar transport system substrate-binding protein
MKRIFTWLGLLAGAVTVASVLMWNPSAKREYTDGKTHIRYWTIVGMKDVIPYFARTFGDVQGRIVVETTPIPWQEHEKKILTAVVSGDPPDVVNQITPVAKWASRMALLPLDEFIRRDRFDTTMIFPALWDEMRWRGRIYAIPVYSGSYALFYNKAAFREVGLDPERPPRSWDEVWEYNERLTRRDERGRLTRMGFIPNYGNVQTFMLMAWERGAKFLSDDGLRVNLADTAVVRALEWVVRFYQHFAVRDVSAFTGGFGFAEQHGFISGKLAMMVLDSSFPDQIKLYRPTLDYGVALVPTFDGCPPASASGSWWMAIPSGAKYPEAGWEFIKYAVSKEIQLREVEMTEESLFPANRLAASDPRFMKNHEREVFVTMMDYSHSPSVVPMAHDVFWREVMGAQERVMHGQQNPVEALRQGEDVLQKVLDEAMDYDKYVQSKLSRE